MSTAAIAVLSNFERDRWNADVYGAMALASQLSALVKNRALTIRLAYYFWRLNSILGDFFVDVRKAIKAGAPKDQALATPERVLEMAQDLRKVHRTIEHIYGCAKRAGLTNNSLTAGALKSVCNYNEDVLELAELLELSLKPELVESIYDRARAERERGEVFDLSEVE
jgi:hypothetical protein